MDEQPDHHPASTPPAPAPDTGRLQADAPVSPRPPQPGATGPLMSERSRATTVWFVHANRERLGPFSGDEIVDRLRDGTFLPKHYAWHIGFGEHWKRLRDIDEFHGALTSPPPLPAATPATDSPVSPAAGASASAATSTASSKLPPRPAEAASIGLTCTNCLEPINREWLTCPNCGFTLRATIPTVWTRMAGEPVHRAIALGGAGLAVAALIMPWIHASTNAGARAAVGGLMVPGGELLALLAWLILGFALQAVAGGPHRALLTWLLALGAGLLVTQFAIDLRAQAAMMLASAAPGMAETGARVQPGLGWFVFALGIGLVLVADLVPAMVRLFRRPLAGGAVAVAIVALGFGVLQLVNGNLYRPLLRLQLGAAGYDQIEVTHVPDGGATELLDVRCWRDGHLYIGRHEFPRGSIWPMRSVRLQAVPDVDLPLFPPRQPASTDDGKAGSR
ncbi:MAG: DUF4339 domain-containing protein [Planctomycetota bacterium]